MNTDSESKPWLQSSSILVCVVTRYILIICVFKRLLLFVNAVGDEVLCEESSGSSKRLQEKNGHFNLKVDNVDSLSTGPLVKMERINLVLTTFFGFCIHA